MTRSPVQRLRGALEWERRRADMYGYWPSRETERAYQKARNATEAAIEELAQELGEKVNA